MDFQFRSADELIKFLSLNGQEKKATKLLTQYYATARFGISDRDFDKYYFDGQNDGGIDFGYIDGNSAYIIQTKFSQSPKKSSPEMIMREIEKICKTLLFGGASDSVSDFLRRVKEKNISTIELIWLTTDIIPSDTISDIKRHLDSQLKNSQYKLNFYVIDKNRLEMFIYDVIHGYVPNVGIKELQFMSGQVFEVDDNNVKALCGTIRIYDILNWFNSDENQDMDRFLQKNVRHFIASSKVNREIVTSYATEPSWFWYKHNGIIIFVDDLSFNHETNIVSLRNPQVVNGGQTLKALFECYKKGNCETNDARVLVRIYKFPFESTETYDVSVEIIKALNSQNAIKPSDLRVPDPRQVRLERLFLQVGQRYNYIRKRGDQKKQSKFSIDMRKMALYYYVAKKSAPEEGIRGNIEEIFSDKTKYDTVFDERKIWKKFDDSHIIYDYLIAWKIFQSLSKEGLNEKERQLFKYMRWYVLVTLYHKFQTWREKQSNRSDLIEFLESEQFKKLVQRAAKKLLRLLTGKVDRQPEPKNYLRNKKNAQKLLRIANAKNDFDKVLNRYYLRFQRKQGFI